MKQLIKISFLLDTCYALHMNHGIFLSIIEIMSVIIILLAASIAVAALFLIAFLWGVSSGQFEDDYSPASRILFDDKPKRSNPTNK